MRYCARFFCLLIVLISPFSVVYADEKGAGDFVTSISEKAIAVISSSRSDAEKEKDLSAMFDDVVDVEWISRFAIGKYWRECSEEEKKQYKISYTKYLHGSYIPKFKTYTNQEIDITGIEQDGDNEFVVRTEIVNTSKSSEGGAVFKVDYRIRENNGRYKVFDIIAEGISLISTQRSDFSAILSRGGMKSLIAQLDKPRANSDAGTAIKSLESGK